MHQPTKFFSIVFLIVLGVFAIVNTAIAQTLSVEEQIKQSEASLWIAYQRHDDVRLTELLADDLSFTKENGFLSNKETELRIQKNLRASGRDSQKKVVTNPDALDFNHHVASVKMYGSTGVTTGYFREKEGEQFVWLHFTKTWVQRDGNWQVVAIHISVVSDSVKRKLGYE